MAWQGLRPESLLNLWRQEGCTGCKDRETCINCEDRKIQPREKGLLLWKTDDFFERSVERRTSFSNIDAGIMTCELYRNILTY